MGYTTTFTGRVNLSRELTASEAQILLDFSEERHSPSETPGYNCDWEPTKDGLGIQHNGCEKFYDADAWMQYIINEFLDKWGITTNGTINAQGEDATDVWRLKVVDNVVIRVKGRVVFEDA